MLTVRMLDSASCSMHVEAGATVSEFKKQASKELGVSWWEQQWTDPKGGGDVLANRHALDV